MPGDVARGEKNEEEHGETGGEHDRAAPGAGALGQDGRAAAALADVFAPARDEERDDDAEARDDDVAKGGDDQAIRSDDGLRPMRGARRELL
jgi:hypothetical protein